MLHHLALIPDGNRRWAVAQSFLPWKGHEKGADRFLEIAEYAFASGIPYVTLWAASYDNLIKRAPIEITFLCSLLRRTLTDNNIIQRFLDHHIRVQIVGEGKVYINDGKLTEAIETAERRTHHFQDNHLTILFGYDGKREMQDAIEKLRGNIAVPINSETIQAHLWTGSLPPVDLVVRTGGEPHWSAGFMMWHTADSQFYFTETLWPDFDTKELEKALDSYAKRDRRFGK